jgi:hypothetical protein
MRGLTIIWSCLLLAGCGGGPGTGSGGGSGGGGGGVGGGGGSGGGVSTPVCGDGKCNGSESSANCCIDCGCASGQMCMGNSCVATPACGDGTCNGSETQATCCQDCGCASGQACKSGSCVAVDVCGDGTCGATENPNNCCDDCGCNNGSSCVNHACKYVGTSAMTWSIGDTCNDGENIEIVFFDESDKLAWNPTYVSYGTTSSTINCTTGDLICIGGRQSGHGLYWGVDVDDSKTCPSGGCCYFCGAGTVTFDPSCN